MTSGGAHLPDRELAARAVAGDDGAFAELVRRHERRVYNLALRMLGRSEDARDAAQDAFVSCYRNLSKFRGEAAFSTWLHRIAVNACYDVLRRRRDVLGLDEAPEPPPAADHGDAVTTSVDVRRALLAIPDEFRTVLVLHDIQDLGYDEIARILEVPVGTVKSRLHRARVALGRALGGEPSPPSDPSNEGMP
ncbi:MAG TPA: sigma-70 family RNA polymerase sigma factor [Actinomycetota bacterium]|nr:sigma-70 family RNA polymerase sigma factor [Actinomycetota bacterium]